MIALTLIRLAYLEINASASTKLLYQILYACEKYDYFNNIIVINAYISKDTAIYVQLIAIGISHIF